MEGVNCTVHVYITYNIALRFRSHDHLSAHYSISNIQLVTEDPSYYPGSLGKFPLPGLLSHSLYLRGGIFNHLHLQAGRFLGPSIPYLLS